jgi:hypothetical protein
VRDKGGRERETARFAGASARRRDRGEAKYILVFNFIIALFYDYSILKDTGRVA